MAYRSRLQRVEEKRSLRRAFWYMALGVLIILFFITYGLKVLAGLALFIDNLKASGRTIGSTDLIPPAPPRLWTESLATNSANLRLSGSAEAGSTVYLTKNGEIGGGMVVGDDGGFVFTTIQLAEGNNSFIAVVVDKAGNKSQKSTELVVYFSQKKPSLTIFSPNEGQVFAGDNRIEIKGQTDKGTRVTVNGRITLVDDEGKFVKSYLLSGGDNWLSIKATNSTGNQETKELKVIFNQ